MDVSRVSFFSMLISVGAALCDHVISGFAVCSPRVASVETSPAVQMIDDDDDDDDDEDEEDRAAKKARYNPSMPSDGAQSSSIAPFDEQKALSVRVPDIASKSDLVVLSESFVEDITCTSKQHFFFQFTTMFQSLLLVCHDFILMGMILECSHTFCRHCLRKWLKTTPV